MITLMQMLTCYEDINVWTSSIASGHYCSCYWLTSTYPVNFPQECREITPEKQRLSPSHRRLAWSALFPSLVSFFFSDAWIQLGFCWTQHRASRGWSLVWSHAVAPMCQSQQGDSHVWLLSPAFLVLKPAPWWQRQASRVEGSLSSVLSSVVN